MPDDFDISGIDEVIHGRLRLGVMAYLTGAGSAAVARPGTAIARTAANGRHERSEGLRVNMVSSPFSAHARLSAQVHAVPAA